MRSAIWLLACLGCASARAIAPGWHPSVWRDPPADPTAQDAAVAFDDGQNGTELVLQVLSRARAAGATAISHLELQLGRCTRELAMAPAPVARDPVPELERVTFEVRETAYTCRRAIDQEIYHPKTEGFDDHEGFGEPRTIEREECTHGPLQHVVTRYRVDYDHHFTPPDWATVASWSQLALRAGAPHCDARAPRNELRLRLHFAPAPAPSDAPGPPAGAPTRPDAIIALARQAEAAARANQPAEATRLANLALAAWGDGDAVIGLDEAAGKQLAGWVAGAKYYAIEAEAADLLASQLPIDANAAWAAEQGAAIDRLAARYHAIGEVIRTADAEPWLQAGAAKLASMHRHVAELLDRIDQHRAAEHERRQATSLEAASHGR